MRHELKLIYLVLCAILSSCNYVERKSGGATAGAKEITASSLDFAYVKANVFAPRCVSCHQQYADYPSVKSEIASIRAAVASGRMPKVGGPLTDSQRESLFAWIGGGAPESSSPNPPAEEPTVLKPEWESISRGLIFPKCLVCHNLNGQAKFLDLSTREAIDAGRDRVFPGGVKLFDVQNPEASYVIGLVTDPTDPMPPPPPFSKIPRLSETEVGVLTEWIRRGLP